MEAISIERIFKELLDLNKEGETLKIQIGSKGEIVIPKKLRKKLGLKNWDQVILEMSDDKLLIRKIPDLLNLLDLPPIGQLESVEDIEKDLEEIQKEQMELSGEEQ